MNSDDLVSSINVLYVIGEKKLFQSVSKNRKKTWISSTYCLALNLRIDSSTSNWAISPFQAIVSHQKSLCFSTEDRRKSSGPASRGESIDKVLEGGGGDEDQPQSTSIQPTTVTERSSASSKSTSQSPTKIATTGTTTPDSNH